MCIDIKDLSYITDLIEEYSEARGPQIIVFMDIRDVNYFKPENILFLGKQEGGCSGGKGYRYLDKDNLEDWLEDNNISELYWKNIIG